MAKAASAEINNKRYYHHVPDGAEPCECGDRIDPKCSYSLLSVTTILDNLPKPWLGAWAAKMVAQTALDELANLASMQAAEGREAVEKYLKGAPWRKRDAAAERGTATHTAAELGTDIADVPDDVRGKVIAYHMWLDDYSPTIEYQEVTIYNPLEGYAGTGDILATLTGLGPKWDGRWLIDIKTGVMSWTHRLQQAAYRFGSFIGDERGRYVSRVPWADHVGILSLTDDGYSFYEIEAGEIEYAAFLHVASVARDVDVLSKGKDALVGQRWLQ